MSKGKIIGFSVLGLVLILGLSIGLGWFGVFYQGTVGKASQNMQREVFEETVAYNKGMATDLAKYKLEFEMTKDVTEKTAIINYLIGKYSDFPESNLEDVRLRKFLSDVKNGNYNNLKEVSK